MISRNGVHLPDTTYGGNPIDWNCSSDSDDSLQRLEAENRKLRELVRLMVRRHTPISPCKNIPCGECPVKDECDQEDALMRELGVEL